MVFDNKLLIVKPFWIKREKVYFKNEIDRIRFYKDKSVNLGGRFMEIKIKSNSKIHNFRIELSKKDRDCFISFLKDKNYNIINCDYFTYRKCPTILQLNKQSSKTCPPPTLCTIKLRLPSADFLCVTIPMCGSLSLIIQVTKSPVL